MMDVCSDEIVVFLIVLRMDLAGDCVRKVSSICVGGSSAGLMVRKYLSRKVTIVQLSMSSILMLQLPIRSVKLTGWLRDLNLFSGRRPVTVPAALNGRICSESGM